MDLLNVALAKAMVKEYIESSQADLSNITYYYCSTNEYNSQTGVPTIASPQVDTLYIVPGSGDDIFNVYVYKNNNWELFKSTSVITDMENILVIE